MRTCGNEKWRDRACWGCRGRGPQVISSIGEPDRKLSVKCIGQNGVHTEVPAEDRKGVQG